MSVSDVLYVQKIFDIQKISDIQRNFVGAFYVARPYVVVCGATKLQHSLTQIIEKLALQTCLEQEARYRYLYSTV